MIDTNTIKTLLFMQDELNAATCGNDWKTNNICTSSNREVVFPLAAYLETSELIDSLNWKHWKDINSDDDLNNLMIEFVDIYHFQMSMMLITGNSEELIKSLHSINVNNIPSKNELISSAVNYSCVLSKVVNGEIDIYNINDPIVEFSIDISSKFVELMSNVLGYCDADYEDVVKIYTYKNALNLFRLKNGYKEGTYIKNWNGREDNVVLMEALDGVDETLSLKEINTILEDLYSTVSETKKQ